MLDNDGFFEELDNYYEECYGKRHEPDYRAEYALWSFRPSINKGRYRRGIVRCIGYSSDLKLVKLLKIIEEECYTSKFGDYKGEVTYEQAKEYIENFNAYIDTHTADCSLETRNKLIKLVANLDLWKEVPLNKSASSKNQINKSSSSYIFPSFVEFLQYLDKSEPEELDKYVAYVDRVLKLPKQQKLKVFYEEDLSLFDKSTTWIDRFLNHFTFKAS